jgi:hypothetical protein
MNPNSYVRIEFSFNSDVRVLMAWEVQFRQVLLSIHFNTTKPQRQYFKDFKSGYLGGLHIGPPRPVRFSDDVDRGFCFLDQRIAKR